MNGKLRLIIALIAGIAFILAIIFIYHIRSQQRMTTTGSASVSGAPQLTSVPGAGDPSTQYVQYQTQQNILQAQAARQRGTSAVPTITRPTFAGNISQFGTLPQDDGSQPACSAKKVVVMYKPNPSGCLADNLKTARDTGVTAEELVCQGCSCPALKLAGYTAGDLKKIGYSAEQLKTCGFSLSDLVAAGFTPAELKAAGYSAADLAKAGFDPSQLATAGYLPKELKDAGFTAKQLADAGLSADKLGEAGFSPSEIAASGAAGKSITTKPNCSVQYLQQQRTQGVTAAQLRKTGCDLAALKAAGFSAGDLKDAGYNAGQLGAAGFNTDDLKNAGFSPDDLHKAGFSAAALKDAGFAPTDLANAGYTKGDLLRAGYSPEEAGYSAAKTAVSPSGVTTAAPQQAQTNTTDAGASMPSIDQTPQGSLATLTRAQQQQMTDQQRQDLVAQQQGAMILQAQKLLAGWSNNPQQVNETAPKDLTTGAAGSASAAGGAAGAANANTGPTIKAGEVFFAVLDTGVNTDEKSPIMAHIVSGSLEGAKLLGQFVRVDTKVVLQFTLLNMPQYDKSMTVNAVAIDPDTARTALSGQVNNHYLLRYGTLFASAFLQGVGTAVQNSNSTTMCFGFGCTQTYAPLNPTEIVLVGAGTVGARASSAMSDVFNMPPTVKIESGTGIGILLMSDLTLPQPDINSQQSAEVTQ